VLSRVLVHSTYLKYLLFCCDISGYFIVHVFINSSFPCFQHCLYWSIVIKNVRNSLVQNFFVDHHWILANPKFLGPAKNKMTTKTALQTIFIHQDLLDQTKCTFCPKRICKSFSETIFKCSNCSALSHRFHGVAFICQFPANTVDPLMHACQVSCWLTGLPLELRKILFICPTCPNAPLLQLHWQKQMSWVMQRKRQPAQDESAKANKSIKQFLHPLKHATNHVKWQRNQQLDPVQSQTSLTKKTKMQNCQIATQLDALWAVWRLTTVTQHSHTTQSHHCWVDKVETAN